jgi:hypothetical protein
MALRITTARYYTPSGRSIDRRIAPRDSSLDAVVRPESPDTAAVFRTKGGRTVRGGGGIRPDREIVPAPPDTFVAGLERDGLLALFPSRSGAAGEPSVEEFQRFLESRGRSGHGEEVRRSFPAIAARLRREAAYRDHREDLARRAALESDEAFQTALALLRSARSTEELLALAGRGAEDGADPPAGEAPAGRTEEKTR